MTQVGHTARRQMVAGRGARQVLDCADGGTGTITRYDLLPGVALWMLDMRTRAQGYLPGLEGGKGSSYIIHCAKGELRVALGLRKVFSLAEGDLLCASSESGRIAHSFPTGSFSGLVLCIDPSKLTVETRRALHNLEVDLDAIPLVPSSNDPRPLAASAEAIRISGELAEMLPHANRGAIRLKAIELLRLVGRGEASAEALKVRPGRRASHMRLAYRARQLMARDIARPLTIQKLADACDTSPTVLKEAFRETFGVPVYSWYKTYRMHQAADLLLSTDLPVSEVAERVGYANPSKFAHAFADCMGKTPLAWRKDRSARREGQVE